MQLTAVDEVARLRVALVRTTRWLERQSQADGAPGSELSRTQLSVLGAVVRCGPVRLGELAGLEGVNPTMLSRVVAKLDDAGLLERTTDPDDRRVATVSATELGRTQHLAMRAARDRLLTERLAALDPADRDRLVAALPALEALAR
ncbi:MarR family winged helix-turn-helix transcriptional regulator [Rhodococcus aerolatus]